MFEIPVYLRSYEQYYLEHAEFENREINKFSKLSGLSPEEERKRLEDSPYWHEQLTWWPPWKYNDIIGWISINYDGRFFAELWRLRKKRISRDPRHRKGNVTYCGKVTECFAGKSNDELRQGLIDILNQITKELKKEHFFIDTQYWISIVSSLDCKRSIESQYR